MKMEIHNPHDNNFDYFLISRSVQSPTCMAGRATRGYWSVKVEGEHAHQVFFIKDTWRVADRSLHREESTYRELNDEGKEVVNVGTMYCGRGVHNNPSCDLGRRACRQVRLVFL